jgi:23S rRNA pseudouridine2457 synthase
MNSSSDTLVILFYKPYGILSQFTQGTTSGRWMTLSEFGPFPRDVYPAGRLDADSEGLLLLTNQRLITQRLLEPRFRHPRTYCVQVEGVPSSGALDRLRKGLIVIEGKKVFPAEVRLLAGAPDLPPRAVPIRARKAIPTSWLELTLTEGRNRQVRRMTAAVGHPTLRLVRTAIGILTLKGLDPGTWRALSGRESARFQETLRRGTASGHR